MVSDRARYERRKAEIVPRMDGERCCTKCWKIKPITEFPKHPLGIDGRAPSCRSCESARIQRRKHGLSRDDKTAIAEAQGGCRICQRKTPGGKGWVVDHDHACCPGETSCENCRRGVLCQWCNNALGYAMDSPALLRAMADYLEESASRTYSPTYSSTNSTNERTLRTDVEGTSGHGDITLSHAREKSAK